MMVAQQAPALRKSQAVNTPDGLHRFLSQATALPCLSSGATLL